MTGSTRQLSDVIDAPCPCCGERAQRIFFSERDIPMNSCLLLDDVETARRFPRGDLDLAHCEACGFVSNTSFVPDTAEYSQRYEETQIFSGRFAEFARELAQRWVDDYHLADKTVLEIGCGKGEFLVMMAEAGAGESIGIDPGVHPERIDSDVDDRITWIADFYGEKYSHLAADAVVCRHTLEHIPNVAEFLTTIRRSIGDRPDTVVLFELPDVRRILEETAFWDIYYEHCSYFSAGSLARVFRRTGFEVLDVSLEYDDQYLLIECRPSTVPAAGEPLPIEDDLDILAKGVTNFVEEYARLRDEWHERLAAVASSGGKAVIWGGGSKGVSFLTNLGIADEVAAAVDINPYKHGKFMAGTGHPVIGPDDLVALDPQLVVVMNPIYVEEIRAELDRRGLHPEIVAV